LPLSRPALGPHPVPFTLGTGSFPGVKRPGRGADHPPPSSAEVKKSRAVPLLPLWVFGSVTRQTCGDLRFYIAF
jgi:hypothetical protein